MIDATTMHDNKITGDSYALKIRDTLSVPTIDHNESLQMWLERRESM